MIRVIEERKHSTCFDDLKKQVEETVDDIKGVEDIGTFLAEEALDVARKQNLIGGKWETEYYELCLAWGGPGLWVRTDGIITGAWWGDYLKVKVEDPGFLAKLEEIQEYLDEVT